MKICDIVQFYSPLSGGVKRYIHDKMEALAGKNSIGHCVIVPSDRDDIKVTGRTRIHEIASPPLPGSKSYRMLLSRRRILSAIREELPDIIEVGDPYRAAWIGIEAGARHRIPVVAFYHSDYPRALGRTIRRFAGPGAERLFPGLISLYLKNLYNRMDLTIVPSKRLVTVLAGLGVRRLVHIPLGTNTDVFRPRNSRERILRELGLPASTFLLIYAGRLALEKNIRSLVSMMDLFLPDKDPFHLLLVGDGELSAFVRRRSADSSSVTHLPYVDSRERLADLYSASDLFIHAGTGETFGLVAAEAQACGTRVLGVRGGGLDEVIGEESNSMMAENPSAMALAECVRKIRLAGDPPGQKTQRIERIRNSYSTARTFEQLIEAYLETMNRKRVDILQQTAREKSHDLRDQALSSG